MGSNHNVSYLISLAKIIDIGKSLSNEKMKAVKEEEIIYQISFSICKVDNILDLEGKKFFRH